MNSTLIKKEALTKRLICCLLLLQLATNASASARQSGDAYTPERGTPERQAITDALRAPVQKQLKQKVVFKIDHLKVQGGWAFLRGVPRQPDGKPLDYKDTVYQSQIDEGAFDDGFCALLRKRGDKWTVVTYVIGATDVPYVEWGKKYKAPSAIFD